MRGSKSSFKVGGEDYESLQANPGPSIHFILRSRPIGHGAARTRRSRTNGGRSMHSRRKRLLPGEIYGLDKWRLDR